MQWIASIAVAAVLRHLTYYAEADGLNVVFGMHRKIKHVTQTLSHIADPKNTSDVVTAAITKLYNQGHLQTKTLDHWIQQGLVAVQPAARYWEMRTSPGLHGTYYLQCRLYEIADNFNPHMCGGTDFLYLQQAYRRLNEFHFPDDMVVAGLKQEAHRACIECRGLLYSEFLMLSTIGINEAMNFLNTQLQ